MMISENTHSYIQSTFAISNSQWRVFELPGPSAALQPSLQETEVVIKVETYLMASRVSI